MKSNDPTDEHHDINERKSRPKKCQSCKYIYQIHIAYPAVIYFLVEHVRLHFILLLIKLINGFEFIVEKLGFWLFFFALTILFDFELSIGPDCTDDRKD